MPASLPTTTGPVAAATNGLTSPEGTPQGPVLRKETFGMKVKWKQQVARLIPATTMVAAAVVAISAYAGSVKWA